MKLTPENRKALEGALREPVRISREHISDKDAARILKAYNAAALLLEIWEPLAEMESKIDIEDFQESLALLEAETNGTIRTAPIESLQIVIDAGTIAANALAAIRKAVVDE